MSYEIDEIVQMYKEAADKNKQIKILADLNCCSKEEILNILAEAGAISGVKPSKMQKKQVDKRRSERGKWTEERLEQLQRFIEEGLTYEEIGERMGENARAIGNAVYNYKLRGNGEKNPIEKDKMQQFQDTRKGAETAPDKKDKLLEKAQRKMIQMQNELDDIACVAKIVKDIINMVTMVSAEELEDYESTVQTLLISAGELTQEIIKRAESEWN